MSRLRSVGFALVAAFVAACSSDGSGDPPPLGAWGSNQGSLTVADTTAHLLIANGNCYTASGDISGRIPSGHFSMSGTFRQVIGVPPGYVEYPAQYTGTADASVISVTVTVTTIGLSLGPVNVAYGVTKDLTPCAVP